MSTAFKIKTPFETKQAFIDQVEKGGWKVVVDDLTPAYKLSFAITDGSNFVWVFLSNEDGPDLIVELEKYGMNTVGNLYSIFGDDLISEHDEGFFNDTDWEDYVDDDGWDEEDDEDNYEEPFND